MEFTSTSQEVLIDTVDISRGEFGVTLWFNTTQTNSTILSSTDGSVEIYLHDGQVCGWVEMDRPIWEKNETCTKGSYADGVWHQVALTSFVDDAIGYPAFFIYLDGEIVLPGNAGYYNRAACYPGLAVFVQGRRNPFQSADDSLDSSTVIYSDESYLLAGLRALKDFEASIP